LRSDRRLERRAGDIPTWSREAGDNNTLAERITYEGKNDRDDETFRGLAGLVPGTRDAQSDLE
jgi:hypothetical protein